MLAHKNKITIHSGVGSQGYKIAVVDGLNAIDNSFFTMSMATFQPTDTAGS